MLDSSWHPRCQGVWRRWSPRRRNSSAGESSTLGRQKWVYHKLPSEFPPDFPQRLESLKEATGLTWLGALGVDARMLRRWRTGTQPGSGHLIALFRFADGLGLLRHLLPEAADQEGVG